MSSYIKHVFQAARTGPVEVHADDTDVAVMLVHHWEDELHDIVFSSHQAKKKWSVKSSCATLSADIKDVLLFIHAFSGCDSTSALFGIGKATILKKFQGIEQYILFAC